MSLELVQPLEYFFNEVFVMVVMFSKPIRWIMSLRGDVVVPFTFAGIMSAYGKPKMLCFHSWWMILDLKQMKRELYGTLSSLLKTIFTLVLKLMISFKYRQS